MKVGRLLSKNAQKCGNGIFFKKKVIPALFAHFWRVVSTPSKEFLEVKKVEYIYIYFNAGYGGELS